MTAFPQMRLLELDADAILQAIDVAKGIEAEHRIGRRGGPPDPFHAFQRRGLAGTVGPISPKISPSWTSKDTSSTATVCPVGLADPGDGDHVRGHTEAYSA